MRFREFLETAEQLSQQWTDHATRQEIEGLADLTRVVQGRIDELRLPRVGMTIGLAALMLTAMQPVVSMVAMRYSHLSQAQLLDLVRRAMEEEGR